MAKVKEKSVLELVQTDDEARRGDNSCPRTYYFTNYPRLGKLELECLERVTRRACKHITGVTVCERTPRGTPASFYISWGMDRQAKSTPAHIKEHFPDVHRAILGCIG